MFEANPFCFKPPLLERVPAAAGGKGNSAAAVDYAMPRQPGSRRKIAQGMADEAGAAGQAGEFGYLTVSGNLAPRNSGHDMPYFFLVDAHAR